MIGERCALDDINLGALSTSWYQEAGGGTMYMYNGTLYPIILFSHGSSHGPRTPVHLL